MLIEGSGGSSRGMVGEHQPDEPMRDGGRWAGRSGRGERDEGLAAGRGGARTGMARDGRRDYLAFHDKQGAVARRQD